MHRKIHNRCSISFKVSDIYYFKGYTTILIIIQAISILTIVWLICSIKHDCDEEQHLQQTVRFNFNY